MSTIDDLSRILRKVNEEFRGPEILRVVLHPKNYMGLQRDAAFVAAPPDGVQIPCRGHLWGVPIHVDPRNEENVAYVVTQDTERARSRGMVYKLNAPPEIPRPTAWSRVLDDDPLGVD